MKALAASALTAAVLAAGGIAHTASVNQAQRYAPACPHPTYNADGNMSPLFCVIDNPLALRYYASMGRHTFALGPNASPYKVATALVADYYKRAGTETILCSVYRLAAWRNHWRFGVSPVANVSVQLHFPATWCNEPRFKVGS